MQIVATPLELVPLLLDESAPSLMTRLSDFFMVQYSTARGHSMVLVNSKNDGRKYIEVERVQREYVMTWSYGNVVCYPNMVWSTHSANGVVQCHECIRLL